MFSSLAGSCGCGCCCCSFFFFLFFSSFLVETSLVPIAFPASMKRTSAEVLSSSAVLLSLSAARVEMKRAGWLRHVMTEVLLKDGKQGPGWVLWDNDFSCSSVLCYCCCGWCCGCCCCCCCVLVVVVDLLLLLLLLPCRNFTGS